MSVQTSEVDQNITNSPKTLNVGTEGDNQIDNSNDKVNGDKTEENKLFVSNFPHSYTGQQVEDYFSPAGKILKVKIIQRNRRSMGYGFVSFENPESTEKAIELFNGKEIEGRPLKVEVAVEKSKNPKPRTSKPRRKPQRKNTEGNENVENQENGNQEPSNTEEKPKNTRPRRNKKRSSTAPKDAAATSSPQEPQIKNESPSVKKESPTESPANGVSDEQGDSKSKSTKPRNGQRNFRRKSFNSRRKSSPGEPSETSLYVSNLPFSLTDEGLLQVFGTFGAVKAHVVRNSHYKRSKGYGFVEFSNNEDQLRALKDLGEVEINGRVLSVSIALNRPSSIDEADSAQPAPVEA